MENLPKPVYRYYFGFVAEDKYFRVFRDDKLGVRYEVTTRRKYGAPVGKGTVRFFMDDNDFAFKDEESMLRTWMAREENRKRNTAPPPTE